MPALTHYSAYDSQIAANILKSEGLVAGISKYPPKKSQKNMMLRYTGRRTPLLPLCARRRFLSVFPGNPKALSPKKLVAPFQVHVPAVGEHASTPDSAHLPIQFVVQFSKATISVTFSSSETDFTDFGLSFHKITAN
jgi:hypothetical protein